MGTLKNKIDFAVILSVTNANPNGDPLNGNRPRINNEGFGEMTDVCLKRKMRDRLLESGRSIYVQNDSKKIDDATCLRDRVEKTLGKNLSMEEIATKGCKEWFDVRAFGQLFAFKKDKEDNGDPGVSVGITGPVSIHHAFSVDPVTISSVQITKSVCSTEPKDGKKKSSDTMGMKHLVDKGIYVFFGSMNPQLAKKTGFSDEDAIVFKEILPKLFENDASSARPEGSMEVLKVFWWEQKGYGKYSSAKVHRSLAVHADGSYKLSDMESLKPEVIEGY